MRDNNGSARHLESSKARVPVWKRLVRAASYGIVALTFLALTDHGVLPRTGFVFVAGFVVLVGVPMLVSLLLGLPLFW
jgi:hypothetical protein